MKRRDLEHSVVIRWIIAIADVIVLISCLSIVYYVLGNHDPAVVKGVNLQTYLLSAVLAYVPVSFSIPPILLGRVVRVDRIVQRVANLAFMHALVFLGILFLLKDAAIARIYIISAFSIYAIMLCCERLFMHRFVRYFRSHGRNSQHVVLVGESDELRDVIDHMQNKEYGYNVLGQFSNSAQDNNTIKHLGDTSDVLTFLQKHTEVNDVYCTMSSLSQEKLLALYRYCENNLIRFYALPMSLSVLRKKMVITEISGTLMLSPRQEPLRDLGNRIAKRTVDILVSGTFLFTIFPLIYVVVAFIIKRQSPGPVLFLQARSGLDGKMFKCIKFRSMHINKDSDMIQATENDPRKFKFGDFMRRTDIDELPQLINVFFGDMSLVGPRPHMLLHTEEYSHLINKYMVRHWVKPGITGWAQVQGLRGETRELRQMEDRVHADIWYVENWSFWLDMRIIWRTIFSSSSRKNAY